jgi:hypothetical protein
VPPAVPALVTGDNCHLDRVCGVRLAGRNNGIGEAAATLVAPGLGRLAHLQDLDLGYPARLLPMLRGPLQSLAIPTSPFESLPPASHPFRFRLAIGRSQAPPEVLGIFQLRPLLLAHQSPPWMSRCPEESCGVGRSNGLGVKGITAIAEQLCKCTSLKIINLWSRFALAALPSSYADCQHHCHASSLP